jgi:hypothetical protein
MNPKKIALLQIATAIFFAAAMIASSFLLKNMQFEQHSKTVILLLIAVWFIPFTFLAQKRKKAKCKSEY